MKPHSSTIFEKARNILLAVAATLFLGALGSGLWERIGGPLWDFSSKLLIDSINIVFRTYKDSIYQEAAYGFSEKGSTLLYLTFLCLLPGAYFLIIIKHPLLRRDEANREGTQRKGGIIRRFFRSKSGLYFFIAITIFVLGNTIVSLMRESYIRGTIIYAHTTIERLAPYIGEEQEKYLISHFRSVREADDYYKFHSRLLKLLKENSLPNYGNKPL